MRRKVFALILAAAFLFSQMTLAEAKGFSGGRSFSKSFGGYSGSSIKSKSGGFTTSKSLGKTTTKSSGGYTGSSSRSIPGSYSKSSPFSSKNFSSGSATSSSGSFGKSSGTSSTIKNTYMEDTYKQQASTRSYKVYQQRLSDEQKKAYDQASGRTYSIGNRVNFEEAMRTRPQRISMFDTRPVIVSANPTYFGGPISYGSASVGIWDLWFLMRASELFWYHHWFDILPYRDYFNAQKFAEMEARVKALEAKYNGVRDPGYLDPGVDPDIQFSDEYMRKNLDKVYYTNRYAGPSVSPIIVLLIIAAIVAALIFILRKVSRPKPKATFQSRIY